MNERPTPIVDSCEFTVPIAGKVIASKTARRLERERDEARDIAEKLSKQGLEMMDENRSLKRERDEAIADRDIARLSALDSDKAHDRMVGELEKVYAERDEAREALEDWENAAAHVEADHPDEVHCGCVPVLRKLLTDARKERDEAREAFSELWQYADALLPEIDEETLNRWNKCIKLY